jgi:hypothetical protein
LPRQEHDREDLLREATALAERVELELPGVMEAVVIGFRRNGSASFFLGSDPVLQFNTAGELRRGYWKGRLIKAEHGRLFSMERTRDAQQVTLVTAPLAAEEADEFLKLMQLRLAGILQAIRSQTIQVLGQVPAEPSLLPRIEGWLAEHASSGAIAHHPNVA